MLLMKAAKFFQNGIRLLKAGMRHRLISADTGQNKPTESLGNLDAAGARIDTSRFVKFVLAPIVATMTSQTVGNSHEYAAHATIGVPNQRAGIMIRLIALIARRKQARTTGDGVRIRVPEIAPISAASSAADTTLIPGIAIKRT